MLARRVVTVQVATIRRDSQLQRRFIHPSRSQLQAPPRPNTRLAKIRFRADGKPRSKLIAFGFGSLILLNLLLLHAIYVVIKDEEMAADILSRIIYLQRTDFTYDSVNFDDPASTLSYFKNLYQCYTQTSEEEVDRVFNELMEIYELKTKAGFTNSSEVKAQHIMRSTAEKIHNSFRDLNLDSIDVFQVMEKAVESLVGLIRDRDGDDSSKHLPVDER